MDKLKKIYVKYEEAINYLIVGCTTSLISFITYLISTRTFLNPDNSLHLQIANMLKWNVGVVFAYFANKNFVFKTKPENMTKEFLKFASSRVLTLLMDMGLMAALVLYLKVNDILAYMISLIAVTISNFIISKFFVFRSREK